MKGYRIELAGWEWVQYVVAEDAPRAKYGVVNRARDATGHPAAFIFGCIRSCRRCPALDGLGPGEHATYELWSGGERPLPYGHNRTEIHRRGGEAGGR